MMVELSATLPPVRDESAAPVSTAWEEVARGSVDVGEESAAESLGIGSFATDTESDGIAPASVGRLDAVAAASTGAVTVTVIIAAVTMRV